MIKWIIIIILLAGFIYTQYRQKKFNQSVDDKAKEMTDKLNKK
jgi:hypothetical protein